VRKNSGGETFSSGSTLELGRGWGWAPSFLSSILPSWLLVLAEQSRRRLGKPQWLALLPRFWLLLEATVILSCRGAQHLDVGMAAAVMCLCGTGSIPNGKLVALNGQMESLRLEKTSKIIKSNHQDEAHP